MTQNYRAERAIGKDRSSIQSGLLSPSDGVFPLQGLLKEKRLEIYTKQDAWYEPCATRAEACEQSKCVHAACLYLLMYVILHIYNQSIEYYVRLSAACLY